MMCDRDGLAPFETGFHHATHGVMADLLVAVFVAQVDLHSRDVIVGSTQSVLHDVTALSSQHLVTLDVVTGVYLKICMVFSCCECDWFNSGKWRPVPSAPASARPERL